MPQENEKSAEIYARITDTIFAVIMGLSFKEYHWLLAPPVPSLKLAILIFGYLVVVVSRVGYHKSISSKPYKDYKRFLVDLWILYMYFVLAFAPGGMDSPPDIRIVLYAQVGIFGGYLIWDVIKKKEHTDSEISRILITFACLSLTVIILVIFNLATLLSRDMLLGESILDWLFLFSEYLVMVVFWGLKLS